MYSTSLWRTDKIGTRGGGRKGIIEGIKETPAIRNPILLNRTIWVGRRGDEVGGDGEFSPSSLLNLATANTSNCVPKTVPEFNSFLYRPRLLTREVKMTK